MNRFSIFIVLIFFTESAIVIAQERPSARQFPVHDENTESFRYCLNDTISDKQISEIIISVDGKSNSITIIDQKGKSENSRGNYSTNKIIDLRGEDSEVNIIDSGRPNKIKIEQKGKSNSIDIIN